ncbi:polypeptide-interacting protein-binding protein 2 [Triplophysa tibetana]|uniref:Polypeptide-interacting protein-binding protein 2 n=1 Tax=Triplophysa tibetana TaxID=1572043 RepID=A0A5A9P0T3_9TELE|nr:polypeptide-interacting protein-binding protein 2 [Triplophysa tibetana]
MELEVDLNKHFAWLKKVNVQSAGNSESYLERLSRLEGDKESLVLQVSVLTDQVEAQGEKIIDLQSTLQEYQHKLNCTEKMLQQLVISSQKLAGPSSASSSFIIIHKYQYPENELTTRTCLETKKLGLMEEVSCLKLNLGDMEDKQAQSTERQHKAESVVNLISELQEQMCRIRQEISSKITEKPVEMDPEKGCEPVQASLTEPKPAVGQRSGALVMLGHTQTQALHESHNLLQELKMLKNQVQQLEQEKSEYKLKLKVTQGEITSLQQLLSCKNAEIGTLQSQLLSRAPVSVDSAERGQELQRLKAGMETLIAANNEKDRRIGELTLLLTQCRQISDIMTLVQASGDKSVPISSEEDEQNRSIHMKSLTHEAHTELSFSSSSPLLVSSDSSQKDANSRSISMEDLKASSEQKALEGKLVEPGLSEEIHLADKRQQTPSAIQTLSQKRESEASGTDQSSPEDVSLRNTEKMKDTTSSDLSSLSSGADSGQQSPVLQENVKNTSIRKLWGKIKTTGVLSDDLEPTEFRRGGFRATAGPRLTRNPDSGHSACLHTPFCKWNTEQVCSWLEESGFGQYVSLARQWVDRGQTLLSATPQELEKEICIKHPLHRKKLQLALKAFNNKSMEKSSELNHIWVTRWLDDIGLPQYKDQFYESRVDGRMLQYLTVNDLLFLKVTSQLHHLSIKCAIHVLHANKFNPHCLRRRPGDENKTSPSEVVQWSNHRVMEWLRSVDLAEYAPNLRGSGVHGGLVILEPRFNSETLAMLLNIPPQKTLLRRHLATNFSTLVGSQAQQEKREFANASRHAPLTTTAKVRPKKLGFTHFRQLRKLRTEESADYICPMETRAPPILSGSPKRLFASFRGNSPVLDSDLNRLDQAGSSSSLTAPSLQEFKPYSSKIN